MIKDNISQVIIVYCVWKKKNCDSEENETNKKKIKLIVENYVHFSDKG